MIVFDDLGTQVCPPGSPSFLLNFPRVAYNYTTMVWNQAAVDWHASPESTLIYMGKRGGQRSAPQSEIERVLVKHCLEVMPFVPARPCIMLGSRPHFSLTCGQAALTGYAAKYASVLICLGLLALPASF